VIFTTTTTCTGVTTTAVTNNVVHTAVVVAEEVAGAAVADHMKNQVGFRRSNHFHLRILLLANLLRLCMLMWYHLRGIRCLPICQLVVR